MTKRKVTAGELMARLNADPKYVARKAIAERDLQERADEWARAEAPLVADLCEAGVVVASVWDLVNTAAPYPSAVPILLEHLQRAYPGPVREGIARALAVPQARAARRVLIDLYRSEQDRRARDGLAAAIAVVTEDENIGDLIALARDQENGPSRLLLLRALAKSSEPRALAALHDLESDPELGNEARRLLGAT